MAVGYVDAWDRATGEGCWSFNGESGVGLDGGITGIAATAEDGMCLAQGSGMLRWLDARSGHEQWRYASAKPVHTSPVIANDMVLLANDVGTLSAVDASTGTRRWVFQAEDVIRASPVLVAGYVIVVSWDGMVHALTLDGRHVGSAQLAPESADQPAHDVAARPTRIVADASLIVVFDLAAHAVRAFDVELQAEGVACSERWRVATGKDSDVTPLLFGDQVYWVQRDERVATCVDASSGTTLWRQPSDGVPLAGVIAGGRLIVATRDGQLAGLRPSTGEALWRMHTSVSFSSPPAVLDDIAYIGGTDRALYAIRLPKPGD